MTRTNSPKQLSEAQRKVEMVRALREFADRVEKETNSTTVDQLLHGLRLAIDTEINARSAERMRQAMSEK